MKKYSTYKVCRLYSIEVIIWATERHLIMPRLNNLCVQSYNNAGKFMNLLLPAIVRFSLRAGQSDYYGEWVREWVSKAEEYVLDYTVQCGAVQCSAALLVLVNHGVRSSLKAHLFLFSHVGNIESWSCYENWRSHLLKRNCMKWGRICVI